MATPHWRPYRGGIVCGGTDVNSEPHGRVKYRYSGLTFIGMMNHGQEHGKGKIIWPDGHSIEADFDNGNIATGTIRNPDGVIIYQGDYHIYYTLHGTGVKILPDGGIYTGSFKKGKFHGHGAMTYNNGDVYVGSWEEGLRHGMGKYQFSSGDVLSGRWVNDRNDMLLTIEQARGTLDDLHILQDSVAPMVLTIDRWQSVCDKLSNTAKEAGVDAGVIQAIVDEVAAVNANNA